jgi:hypothetical protein
MAAFRRFEIALFCALCLVGAAGAQARSPDLRVEFWADAEAVPQEGDPWPIDEATQLRRLRGEAAYVFAGMTAGFEFEWSPADKTRAIAESFALTPESSIQADEPRLTVEPARKVGGDLYAYARYSPSSLESLSLESYGREPWQSAQGVGKIDFIRGAAGRRAAYEDAARDAVSNLLRILSPNKPRRVRGRLVFAEAPRVALAGGFYTVRLKARIDVTEVLPYEVY